MAEDEQTAKKGLAMRAQQAAEDSAGATRVEGKGMTLYKFPDYETYKSVQVAGNKAKLRMQYVKESHIAILADYLTSQIGRIGFGICHGTRRGAEQGWFRDHLGRGADVIGTEISDTASDYPNTVQWDFHDTNPDWSGRADFVYSNSWDHAFDPAKAFGAWIDALRPGGRLLLDHTKGQGPDATSALDPFGITYNRLRRFLNYEFGQVGELLDSIDTRETNGEYPARVVVFAKAG